MRRSLLLLAALSASVSAQTVRIGVFGLLHPCELSVRAGASSALLVESAGSEEILEGQRSRTFRVTEANQGIIRISSKSGGAADIVLIVPGKLERHFQGVITIQPHGREWRAIVEMDREVAVASIVAAEIVPGAPFELLKAQAVLARSFLAASPARHNDVQFCDTTHCQFLRARPAPTADAYRAAAETRALELTFEGRAFAPLYSAACGGHTLSSATDARGYFYHSVACQYCLRNAHGPVRGHRFGMCQEGAAAMAQDGANFREILNHYYPGTAVLADMLIY